MLMLWFSFIFGLNFIFFCYHTQKQRKIKVKLRIKLNRNTYKTIYMNQVLLNSEFLLCLLFAD